MFVNLYEIVNILFALCSQFGRPLVTSAVQIPTLATVELSRLKTCVVFAVDYFTVHQSICTNFIVDQI
jgi:hypothetical protein